MSVYFHSLFVDNIQQLFRTFEQKIFFHKHIYLQLAFTSYNYTYTLCYTKKLQLTVILYIKVNLQISLFQISSAIEASDQANSAEVLQRLQNTVSYLYNLI